LSFFTTVRCRLAGAVIGGFGRDVAAPVNDTSKHPRLTHTAVDILDDVLAGCVAVYTPVNSQPRAFLRQTSSPSALLSGLVDLAFNRQQDFHHIDDPRGLSGAVGFRLNWG
jgi:hypothetical protein